jgi:hypothetical protein
VEEEGASMDTRDKYCKTAIDWAKDIRQFSGITIHSSGNIEWLRKLSRICRKEGVKCLAVYGRILSREFLSSLAFYKLEHKT